MKNMNLIQYLPLSHPKASLQVVKKLSHFGIMSILDIEDSVQDPFDIKKTIDLKEDARNNFLNFLYKKNWNTYNFNIPIYIRINSISSNFFDDDISFVKEIISNRFPISGVFLPKVESYQHISYTHELLCGKKNNYIDSKFFFDVIPMIETVKGVSALNKILEIDINNQKFSKVHYGHFDYCQDAEIWPFPDPDHSSFWDLVKPIISLLCRYNKTYIHTPFPFPNDHNLFWSVANYIQSLYQKCDIWLCSLNSEISLSQDTENNILKLKKQNNSTSFGTDEAKMIIDNFIAGRANKRSFSMLKDRFIPPHQYRSAKAYLENLEKN